MDDASDTPADGHAPPTCGSCPAFLFDPESVECGRCFGCRQPGVRVDAPPKGVAKERRGPAPWNETTRCLDCNKPAGYTPGCMDFFYLHDELWELIAGTHDVLCFECAQKRLGRPVVMDDLKECVSTRIMRLGARIAKQSEAVEACERGRLPIYEALVKQLEESRAEVAALREALKALAWQHGWIPQGGPCVCDEHRKAAELLAGCAHGDREPEPKE